MRVALVTGAGRGLGAEIARSLGSAGYAVAVNDLIIDAASAVASSIADAGGTATAFPADVTDEQAVRGMVDAISGSLGDVQVLVANASGPQPVIGFEELTWPDVQRHLDFFAKSPLLLAQAVLPGMKRAGVGRIIHIGSDLFERGDLGWSAYMAAKGAMLGLTRGWALELGRFGITVNLIAPGWIPVERHEGTPENLLQDYRDDTAIQRSGTPADIAATVLFLASDGAAFIIGERLAVNGGHTFS
ncbi:MAG: SDR family oxidoreductase [Jatrophihabitans sp.]